MNDKKSPIGYLVAGLVGVVAGAASLLSIFKIFPKIEEKCCGGTESPCCGGHEAAKHGGKKRKH